MYFEDQHAGFMHVPSYVITTSIIAAASALQAGTGMGMALLAAPLLVLIDPALVPGPMLCAVVVLSVAVGWRERTSIDRRSLGLALLGLTGGSVVGAVTLAVLSGLHLAPIFAVVILATRIECARLAYPGEPVGTADGRSSRRHSRHYVWSSRSTDRHHRLQHEPPNVCVPRSALFSPLDARSRCWR